MIGRLLAAAVGDQQDGRAVGQRLSNLARSWLAVCHGEFIASAMTNAARTGGGMIASVPFDGLPDDLVEEQVVSAILDLEIQALGDRGQRGIARVSGVHVDSRRAMVERREIGRGAE